MQSRLAALCLAAALGFHAAGAGAAPEDVIEYKDVSPPVPTSTGDKIEVVELFWYGCPHCYRIEPHVERWMKGKPADVEFVMIPAVLNPTWALHARAFYTAEVMGVLGKVHKPMFEAIHAQRLKLDSLDDIASFFAGQGVDEQEFRKQFRSFAVETKLRRARQLTQQYGIDGVPAFVVGGKFRTDGGLAGTYENVLRVVDGLVAKERKARGQK